MVFSKEFLVKKQPLFIDYTYTYEGGPMRFMQNLQQYLESQKYFATKSIKKANGIFFATRYEIDAVKQIHDRRGVIIQRLDGVFSETVHGKGYHEILDYKYTKEIYQNYSTYYVFQSEYSKNQCFSEYGPVPDTQYQIIINGCDHNVFFPPEERILNKKIRFIIDGNFRKIDMIEPIIKALDELSNELDFELVVIGKVHEDLHHFLKRPYIIYQGFKELDFIAEQLRTANIYLFSHLNPPCPNSVVQAVASGIPIVSFDSGSMKELVDFNTVLLARTPQKMFHTIEDLEYKLFKEKVVYCINNYNDLVQGAVENSERYSLEEMGNKYLQLFKTLI